MFMTYPLPIRFFISLVGILLSCSAFVLETFIILLALCNSAPLRGLSVRLTTSTKVDQELVLI